MRKSGKSVSGKINYTAVVAKPTTDPNDGVADAFTLQGPELPLRGAPEEWAIFANFNAGTNPSARVALALWIPNANNASGAWFVGNTILMKPAADADATAGEVGILPGIGGAQYGKFVVLEITGGPDSIDLELFANEEMVA